MTDFVPFPKIARLNRDIVITEKLDGTNAAIGVTAEGEVYAQSRSRIITPDQDNFGFAAWVHANADDLATILEEGLHFGEWWGRGIQRGYGLEDRRFSLFNTKRWATLDALGMTSVPILYEGPFSELQIAGALADLALTGSRAAPGFMDPEGIVVWHEAARQMFKVTIHGDDAPKSRVAA